VRAAVEVDTRATGSSEWARRLLAQLSGVGWTERSACVELIEWLYAVARHRVRRLGVPPRVRADLVQDAMSVVFQTLHSKRGELTEHTNPASALELLVMHAAGEVYHTHLMAGFGGVAKNGRNWGKPCPRRSSTVNLDESLAAPPLMIHVDDRAAEATQRLSLWIVRNLGLKLTTAAVDATTYVLDRLRAGVSRSSLVRGGYSCLSTDPAMRFLGFDRESAGAFGRWLLGRTDRNILGVIDAAMLGAAVDDVTRTRWRRIAICLGFAEPTSTPPPACAAMPPSLERGRLIA
jgi:hypothetical protein